MTQPAKVQEPSMEEILASIRRIIADDEAKPVVEAVPPRPEPPKVVAAAPKPVAMTDIPPSAIPAAQAAAAKAAPPAPKPAPPPEPAAAVSNSQDDIDAMLASLEAATTEEEIRPALPDGDVFDLTDEMVVADPEPAFQHVEPDDDLEFAEAAAASNERSSQRFDPPSYDPPPMSPQQEILSHHTVSAVESAFNSLANTVLSNNARTLEDLVKEMLRPMLKSWLDDNLPGLVERIVKAEIERVSRGSR
jgi:cell pole-organizing protein PopZ